MGDHKTKDLVRQLRDAGVVGLAGRVKKRFLRLYRATPRPLKAKFDVVSAIQRVSREAFAAFWNRMSPAQRAKYLKAAKK